MYISLFEHRFHFPAKVEPPWSSKVDRWYQLDAYSFGLSDGFEKNKERLGRLADFIFLASPEASNRTDHLFTMTGAISPSKFVHTLPNVRSAPLFQVANWNGPSICLQNDPETEVTGIREAIGLCESDSFVKTVWVFTVATVLQSAGAYDVRIYVVSKDKPGLAEAGEKNFLVEEDRTDRENSDRTDEHWQQWCLENTPGQLSRFPLSSRYQIIRCSLEDFRE